MGIIILSKYRRIKEMIRVCPHCSNVNVNKLKEVIGSENIKTGCIGACRSFTKECVAKVDGELIIKQNEDDLIEYIKNK